MRPSCSITETEGAVSKMYLRLYNNFNWTELVGAQNCFLCLMHWLSLWMQPSYHVTSKWVVCYEQWLLMSQRELRALPRTGKLHSRNYQWHKRWQLFLVTAQKLIRPDYVTRIGNSSHAPIVIVDFATAHPGCDFLPNSVQDSTEGLHWRVDSYRIVVLATLDLRWYGQNNASIQKFVTSSGGSAALVAILVYRIYDKTRPYRSKFKFGRKHSQHKTHMCTLITYLLDIFVGSLMVPSLAGLVRLLETVRSQLSMLRRLPPPLVVKQLRVGLVMFSCLPLPGSRRCVLLRRSSSGSSVGGGGGSRFLLRPRPLFRLIIWEKSCQSLESISHLHRGRREKGQGGGGGGWRGAEKFSILKFQPSTIRGQIGLEKNCTMILNAICRFKVPLWPPCQRSFTCGIQGIQSQTRTYTDLTRSLAAWGVSSSRYHWQSGGGVKGITSGCTTDIVTVRGNVPLCAVGSL